MPLSAAEPEIPAVFITGVSTGIGNAAACLLASGGFRVFGGVRTNADADAVRVAAGERFVPVLLDITDVARIDAASRQVATALDGKPLRALINNAGVAGGGPLAEQPLSQIRQIFDINFFGTLAVTQSFLPLLHPSADGATSLVINVGSVAGRIAAPFLGAYAASKHALEGASDSLRRELHGTGTKVVVVEPGYVDTPIFDKAARLDASAYADSPYRERMERFQRTFIATGRKGMEPLRVARLLRRILLMRNPRARYAIMQRRLTEWWLPNLLSDRWLDGAIRTLERGVG